MFDSNQSQNTYKTGTIKRHRKIGPRTANDTQHLHVFAAHELYKTNDRPTACHDQMIHIFFKPSLIFLSLVYNYLYFICENARNCLLLIFGKNVVCGVAS